MSPPVLYRLDQLERKARGITRANARADQLGRDIASLRARIEAGGSPADFDAAINTLEVRLSALEGGFGEVVTMATSNQEEVARAHARINDLEGFVGSLRRSDEASIPWWGWAIAIAVGLIAGLWWQARDWSSLLDQSEIHSAADWWGSALIFGGGVFSFVLAFVPARTRPEATPRARLDATERLPALERRPFQDART